MKYYLFIEDLLGRRYGILPDGFVSDRINDLCICDTPMEALDRGPVFRGRYLNTSGIDTLIGMCFYFSEEIYANVR